MMRLFLFHTRDGLCEVSVFSLKELEVGELFTPLFDMMARRGAKEGAFLIYRRGDERTDGTVRVFSPEDESLELLFSGDHNVLRLKEYG